MRSGQATFRRDPGFTLIEIIVIVAILAALAGLVAPLARNLILDAKAQKIVELAETLKSATDRYMIDTGQRPNEVSAFPPMFAMTPIDHQLSMDPGVSGWRGPYIDHPLTTGDSPANFLVVLSDGFTPFDLKGDGNLTSGIFVEFDNVPQELAAAVDAKLDPSAVLGDPDWSSWGRVVYDQQNTFLSIFLLKSDP